MTENSKESGGLKGELEPRSVEVFNDLKEFGDRMTAEERELKAQSKIRREAGETVKDQDFEIKAIDFDAGKPDQPALLIVGGMGPLAGVQAGEAAARALLNSREKKNTSLYQLTATPDRTEGIKEKAAGDPAKYDEVIRILEEGILTALKNVESKLGNKEAKIVIICNTAHNYIKDLAKKLPEGIEIVSIIESATKYLKVETGKSPAVNVAALYTDGTKAQKLYSGQFKKEGIKFDEPDEESQANLMDAIYKGVKAFDDKKTLEYGEKALEYLVRRDDITHVLAGCTEIPEVISVVKARTAIPGLKEKLQSLEIVDPVEKALERAL